MQDKIINWVKVTALFIIFIHTGVSGAIEPDFAKQCMEAAKEERAQILKNPFVVQMGEGTLSPKVYKEYLQQDTLYLDKYAEVFSILAEKAIKREDREYLQKLSESAKKEAINLHYKHIPKNLSLPMNRATEEYAKFLMETAKKDLFLGVVATLPCSWIYTEVGNHLLPFVEKNPQHPYAEWIKTYASPSTPQHTLEMIDFVNRLSIDQSIEKREEAKKLFLQAVSFENQFWEIYFTGPDRSPEHLK